MAAFQAAVAFSTLAYAGFGNDEFEETNPTEQDNLEWPKVEFPDADARGRGFKPGEKFVYRAQWGIFKKAGKMEIVTERDTESEEPKMIVRTEMASAGLIRKIYPATLNAKTVLDATNWRMESNENDGKIRSELNKSLTRIDYERGLMKYEDEGEPERNKVINIPYEVPLDYSSTFLQLRGFDLKVGKTYPVVICTKGKFYYVDMSVEGFDSIDTDLGEKRCFRLEPLGSFPQSKLFREGGKLSIWISADSDRIPVRIDVKTSVGTASLRIDAYEKPSADNVAQAEAKKAVSASKAN